MFYKKILATDHKYTMFVSLKKRDNDLSTTKMKQMWRQNQSRFLKDETIYENLAYRFQTIPERIFYIETAKQCPKISL